MKNRSRWNLVLQLAFLAVLCAVAALVIYYGASRTRPGDRQVTFRVEASGGYAIITMEGGKEKISRNATVTTPWERSVRVPRGEEVYLTASNPSQTGTLTCSLKLDFFAWKSDKTVAPKDGVACAGIVH